MVKYISFLLMFYSFGLCGMMLAQQQPSKSLEDSKRPVDDLNQAILKLKGLEYEISYNMPSGFEQNGRMIIDNSPDYPIVIEVSKRDSLHILVLTKLIFVDTVRPAIKPYREKIFDVITLTFGDEELRFADTYCQCNGQEDGSIIALVRDTGEEYLENIIRAWRINRKLNKFEEISPIGIRCLNTGYGC